MKGSASDLSARGYLTLEVLRVNACHCDAHHWQSHKAETIPKKKSCIKRLLGWLTAQCLIVYYFVPFRTPYVQFTEHAVLDLSVCMRDTSLQHLTNSAPTRARTWDLHDRGPQHSPLYQQCCCHRAGLLMTQGSLTFSLLCNVLLHYKCLLNVSLRKNYEFKIKCTKGWICDFLV